MVESLKTLKSLSTRLNRSSDSLNSTLIQINDKLKALNLGVTVWLKDKPLTTRSVEPPDHLKRLHIYKVEDQEIFGYTKVGAYGWCLAVKLVSLAHGHFEGDTSAIFTEETEYDPNPLMHSSRDVRVAAIQLLPELFEALKEKGHEALESIEKAKEFADQL